MLGIGAPLTAAVEDAEQAARFLDEASLPVVVKEDLASNVAGAGRGVTVARPRDDVVAAVRKTAGGRVLLLQEHPSGHPGRVNWLFDGCVDAGSVCRLGATGRKTGQNPAYSGMATAAVVQRNDEVERLALTLLQDAGHAGPVDVDVRFDERDRRYKVLDVNPRVGGTFRLFGAPDGMDVVRDAYLDLTHQLVPISMVPMDVRGSSRRTSPPPDWRTVRTVGSRSGRGSDRWRESTRVRSSALTTSGRCSV